MTDCVWICQVARVRQPTTKVVVRVSPAHLTQDSLCCLSDTK